MVKRQFPILLALLAFVFLVRLAVSLPGDSDRPEPKSFFWDFHGQEIKAELPEIANLIYYFVPDDQCEKPLEEIMVYSRISDSYPAVKIAMVIRDQGGAFSQSRPFFSEWMEERFGYAGPILLDKNDVVPLKFKIATSSKIFFFNDQGGLETVMLPGASNKQRYRDYFNLARNYAKGSDLP